MTYVQHTKCTSRANYIGSVAAQVIIAAAVMALPLLAGAGFVPGLAIVILGAIIAYCRWWLYDRLICLGGDVCALGWVATVEPPSEKSGLDAFDTDYSFSMVLAPGLDGITQADAEQGPQGKLIAPRAETSGLDWQGLQVTQWANRDKSAVLHCEFEGAGVYDLMLAALAALAFATAAAIVCAIPVIGWIACAILSAIAGLIVLGGIIGALSDTGDPNDVDPSLGEIHMNDATGRGADILLVHGTWVYDSAHEGWNEIHPIKQCQRIGTWEGYWDMADPTAYIKRWCDAIGTASDPLTATTQERPEHTWEIHPLIDGCDPGPAPAGTGETVLH
jgi:hypothetical protein